MPLVALSTSRRGFFWRRDTSSPTSGSGSGSSSGSSSRTAFEEDDDADDPAAHNSSAPLREGALAPTQDRLLDVCVNLMEMCVGRADGMGPLSSIDGCSRETLCDLVDAVLYDYTKTPAMQWDLLYAALCLPAAQTEANVRAALMVISEVALPQPLYRLLEASKDVLVLPGFDEESVIRRAVLGRFARALMGGVMEEEEQVRLARQQQLAPAASANASNRLSEEEIMEGYLKDFKEAFPLATKVPAFQAIEQHYVSIGLRSQLYVLLGRLCVELDGKRTGKVRFDELQATAQRVLGKEKAEALLAGARVDSDGKLRYAQLCALITSDGSSSSSSKKG